MHAAAELSVAELGRQDKKLAPCTCDANIKSQAAAEKAGERFLLQLRGGSEAYRRGIAAGDDICTACIWCPGATHTGWARNEHRA